MAGRKVLFVEDNKLEQQVFLQYMKFHKLPYEFSVAGSVAEAKTMLSNERFDVAITDYFLGDGIALDLFEMLVSTPIIVITGAGDEETAIKAMKAGAYDYFVKSSNKDHLKLLSPTLENAIKYRENEEKIRILSRALMSINDAVYITDLNDNLIYVNNSFTKIYGYSFQEVIGKNSHFIWNDGEYSAYKNLLNSEKHHQKFEGEFTNCRKDGTTFPISLSVSHIKDSFSDSIIAYVCIARDITENKKIREELKKYSEELKKYSQGLEIKVDEQSKKLEEAKRFAAIGETATMVGHDLRNPLQVLVNTIFLAKMKLTPKFMEKNKNSVVETVTHTLGVFQEQVDYMNKIVSDLQDIARNIVVEWRETNFKPYIEEIMGSITRPYNIKLNLKLSPSLPNVKLDQGLMKRVLTNLLNNAVQAMEKLSGDIWLTADVEGGKFVVRISDEGTGIPENVQAKLFQPLVTSKAKGMGMGLSVCKRIVEAHGGELSLENNLKKGATAIIKLPLK
ncbi:MAG: PAS domain S-box protein [Bacteroidetes bacterium]|nr:PAS domain S-box protein [Bacteroidota bacterium]